MHTLVQRCNGCLGLLLCGVAHKRTATRLPCRLILHNDDVLDIPKLQQRTDRQGSALLRVRKQIEQAGSRQSPGALVRALLCQVLLPAPLLGSELLLKARLQLLTFWNNGSRSCSVNSLGTHPTNSLNRGLSLVLAQGPLSYSDGSCNSGTGVSVRFAVLPGVVTALPVTLSACTALLHSSRTDCH